MRLFVAADLSDDQRSQLAKKIEEAQRALDFDWIRWLPVSHWHATLLFIGETQEHETAVCDQLSPALSKPLYLEATPHRIQGFPDRWHPRLLALKLEPSSEVLNLVWRLHDCLRQTHNSRHYRMHVSVARFREPDELTLPSFHSALKELTEIKRDAWRIPSVTLFESKLSQSGALYRPV
ncbi:MAG: RNA 2',3'-cyclic phosphodiesterase, partial [Fimbriimonadaceae bacterium]|nr:RNA 2',3'-cyclic phosphodiesterase [Fimbriimonadaceae bacterium]